MARGLEQNKKEDERDGVGRTHARTLESVQRSSQISRTFHFAINAFGFSLDCRRIKGGGGGDAGDTTQPEIPGYTLTYFAVSEPQRKEAARMYHTSGARPHTCPAARSSHLNSTSLIPPRLCLCLVADIHGGRRRGGERANRANKGVRVRHPFFNFLKNRRIWSRVACNLSPKFVSVRGIWRNIAHGKILTVCGSTPFPNFKIRVPGTIVLVHV